MTKDTIAEPHLSILAVERAIRDLRAGYVVRLVHEDGVLLLLSAELATAPRRAWLPETKMLLLSPERAAVLNLAKACGAWREDEDWLLGMIDPLHPLSSASWDTLPLPPGAEAAIALCKLAELLPALLVAKEEKRTDWLSVTVDAITHYPSELLASYQHAATAIVPLEAVGEVRVMSFRPSHGGLEQLAIVVGAPDTHKAVPVRLHSSCLTGDILGSLRCDCGEQLSKALLDAKAAGGGVVLYLNQEGRGIGLANKLKAYTLQDRGQDSFDANMHLGYAEDERDFAIAAVLLRHLGITHIQLMTNNPDKLKAMAAHGIIVEGRLAHHIDPNGVNDAYLQAKKDRRGHL